VGSRKVAEPSAIPMNGDRRRSLLEPYKRCSCGICKKCVENARWDRIFERMAGNSQADERGVFGCSLRDL
jgi:hypothetical protein